MSLSGVVRLMARRSVPRWIAVIVGAACLGSCQHLPSVVLYTSVDEPYAAPVIRQFEREQGVRVRLVTDTEATKSIGLAERVRAEKASPRCDVWWGNEPFNTVLLAEEGLLESRPAEHLVSTPEQFRDPMGRWAGSALRFRVLVIDREFADATTPPIVSLNDLLRPEFMGELAIARPVAGTTMGHVAVMYSVWGPEKFFRFFDALRRQEAAVVGGNGEVVKQVSLGTVKLGLTDNDDVQSSIREGGSVTAVFPDQTEPATDDAHEHFSLPGTVGLPTTVGLVAGRPVNARARLLADYLLSTRVEEQLIAAGFAAASVRDPSMRDGSPVRVVPVDYANIAKIMPTAARLATDILDGKSPAEVR